MSAGTPSMESENVVGVFIFTAYVISALFLTGFISTSLLHGYGSLTPVQKSRRSGELHLNGWLTLCISLSVLSFSVLSYHMLAFLIVSYRSWAWEREILLPSSLSGSSGIIGGLIGQGQREILLWKWLTSSTLFGDFARDICDYWARYWWTSAALMTTMRLSLWTGREGRRRRVPHLWAYFALGQILPISFAQNLFTIALFLATASAPLNASKTAIESLSEQPQSPHESQKLNQEETILQKIFFTIFYSLLLVIPVWKNTSLFIPSILIIRLLLLAPLLISLDDPPGFSYMVYLIPFLASCAAFMCGVSTMSQDLALSSDSGLYDAVEALVKRVVTAINDNHAVQALGWDMLISISSCGLVDLLRRSNIPKLVDTMEYEVVSLPQPREINIRPTPNPLQPRIGLFAALLGDGAIYVSFTTPPPRHTNAVDAVTFEVNPQFPNAMLTTPRLLPTHFEYYLFSSRQCLIHTNVFRVDAITPHNQIPIADTPHHHTACHPPTALPPTLRPPSPRFISYKAVQFWSHNPQRSHLLINVGFLQMEFLSETRTIPWEFVAAFVGEARAQLIRNGFCGVKA
ncbi:hypothetical protein G7Y79_00012g031850 [Physcia stellaris]|nr:hypothetical protein G7Y79_00012g031850 [Physcia stellaris]